MRRFLSSLHLQGHKQIRFNFVLIIIVCIKDHSVKQNKKIILYSFQVAPKFWQTWKEFEIKHGNEDTVREMLRIKRSVQATYNTQVR